MFHCLPHQLTFILEFLKEQYSVYYFPTFFPTVQIDFRDFHHYCVLAY